MGFAVALVLGCLVFGAFEELVIRTVAAATVCVVVTLTAMATETRVHAAVEDSAPDLNLDRPDCSWAIAVGKCLAVAVFVAPTSLLIWTGVGVLIVAVISAAFR